MSNNLEQIFEVSKQHGVFETGGSHGQQGVDFQRFWAIKRMMELEEKGVEDFLILFEAIQDISELNSSTQPDAIKIYQVKKKGRNDWSWNKLTGLKKPNAKKQDHSKIKESLVGKLYEAVFKIKEMDVEGIFISDQRCDIPLKNGGNVATSNQTSVDLIDDCYKSQLNEALEDSYGFEQLSGKIGLIKFDKTDFLAESAQIHLTGLAYEYIKKKSPNHAAQASSFISAILKVIGPLGAKSDQCHSLEEMIAEKSYSKKQFVENVKDLETIPDVTKYLDRYLVALEGEEDFHTITNIQSKVLEYYRNRLESSDNKELEELIDHHISQYGPVYKLKDFLDFMCEKIKSYGLEDNEVKAISIIRVIENAKA